MSERKNARSITSPWEWVAAAISALIVLLLLAGLVRESMRDDRPPDLSVRVDSVVRVSSGWQARFTVRNAGTETAAAVVIEGKIESPGAQPESSRVTLDYVPGGSERRGGLAFSVDPGAGMLRVRALGYQEP